MGFFLDSPISDPPEDRSILLKWMLLLSFFGIVFGTYLEKPVLALDPSPLPADPLAGLVPGSPVPVSAPASVSVPPAPAPVSASVPAPPPGPGGMQAQTPENPMANPSFKPGRAENARVTGSIHDNPYNQTSSSDICRVSDGIHHQYGCDTTNNAVQTAQMSNMMTQMAGTMSTQMMGQSSQVQAMQAGTQSAALEAGAATAKRTGEMQVGMGAINSVLGLYQISKGFSHTRNGKDIQSSAASGGTAVAVDETNAQQGGTLHNDDKTAAGYVTGRNAVQEAIIGNYRLNEKTGIEMQGVTPNQDPSQQTLHQNQLATRKLQGEAQEDAVNSQMRRIADEANGEQRRMASMANFSGMMSLMTGTQQLMNGAAGIQAGNQMEKAAQALKNPKTTSPAAALTLPQANNMSAGAQTAMAPNTIMGSGANPDAPPATDDSIAPTDPPPSLGNGFNPLPMNSGVPLGPTAGKFNIGNPQGGAGGGGGGGVDSSGTTAANQAPTEDPQARLAPNDKGTSYESGGTFSGGGKGGSGRGADGGPDLSALLEKFLPKKDDANSPQNSILQFGNQAPGMDQPLSVLDKNANIFERVHETYQDKHRHGFIRTI